MDKQTVRFYFAYNSPYSFLANTRLARELAPIAVELEYKPVYSPRTAGGPDFNSPKLKYLFADVLRFADSYGLRLNPGPFANSKKACLGFFYAQDKGRRRAYHDAVCNARWLEGKDIGQDATLGEIGAQAGLDPQQLLAALHDPGYEAALQRSNEDAAADEVFGFPFFVYAAQKFWGNDRIEWLVRELGKA